jgi:hypothetical protein
VSFVRTLTSQNTNGTNNPLGQSTTDGMKEKSSEYGQQVKSTANQAADKAREGKLRY